MECDTNPLWLEISSYFVLLIFFFLRARNSVKDPLIGTLNHTISWQQWSSCSWKCRTPLMVIGFRCFSLWFRSSILVFPWGRLAVPPQEALGKHLQSPRSDRSGSASLSFLQARSARFWRDLLQQSLIKLVFFGSTPSNKWGSVYCLLLRLYDKCHWSKFTAPLDIYCCFGGISRNNVEIFQMPWWMTSDNESRFLEAIPNLSTKDKAIWL